MIARKFNINGRLIKRRLIANGVTITRKGRVKRVFTEQHRKNISEGCKGRISWNKNKKMHKKLLYKNMSAHLKYNINLKWLIKFDDIEKLKFLNRVISRHRKYFNRQRYYHFIEKFYKDKIFNKIYKKWLLSNQNRWLRPSIDHIKPRSRGGGFDIINLRFVTWFENRAKADMNLEEWENIKNDIGNYLI